MSKNFELMQKADLDQEIFLTGNIPAEPPSKNGHSNGHSHLASLDHVTREESVKLVQKLFLEEPNGMATRVVLFSGVEPSVGCTTICTRVAETLVSIWDATCCIVDANMRKPRIHNYFQLENEKGLASAVATRGRASSFASQLHGGKLWVMPAGQTTVNAAGVLNSPDLAARIAELKTEFAYVIIDSPPANLYGDAITLGRLCDGVVMVLQSDATRRDAARKTKEIFASASIPILGAVLNRRTYPIPQKLYERL